ncbi:MAG: DUF4012 domain-containing protein [bacterium]
MKRHKQALSQLTIIRLFSGLIKSAIALGKFEYRLFKKITKHRHREAIFWPAVAKILINIGYAVSRIFIWPVKKIFAGAILLFKGFIIIFKTLTYGLLIWPFKQINLGIKKTRKLAAISIGSARVLPRRTVQSVKRIKLNPRISLKPALGFAVLILLFIIPIKLYSDFQFLNELKGKVINISQAAIGELFSAKSAIEENDFIQARQSFSQASANFINAQNQLEVINDSLFVLAKIAPSHTIQLAGNSKHITKAGQLASEVGANVAAAVDSFLVNTEGKKLVQVLDDFSGYGHQALIKAIALNREINQINYNVIPEEYHDEFIAMKGQAEFLQSSLKELLDISDNLQIFLGDYYDKRYLLIFQNNTEMRASGGFMGSFGTIDFSRGEIKNIDTPKGGTYDTEAGLRVLVTAPKPLHLVNPLWHFWDSNWWPDWPTSANKIMWFYEKSNGPTVDGVISLTPTVLERLLEVIGPIDMTEDYDVVIGADNFLMTVQEFAEQKPDETVEPKKIIGDLLPRIIDEISHNLDRDKLINLIDVIDSSLQEKHILLYFTDEQLQDKVNELNWGGQIKNTDMDYLSVINTNIAGAKSDRDMEQKIYLDSTIRLDGTIVNELTIEREHKSIRGEKFSGFRNVDWMRIYVPAGSHLISASGFRQPGGQYFEQPDPEWQTDPDLFHEEEQAMIDESTGTKIYYENNKTVFANWSMVDPGDTTIIKLTYKLPFEIIKQPAPENIIDKLKSMINPDQTYNYTLMVQKQPGALKTNFYYNLDMQQDLETVWHYPEAAGEQLDTDKYWAYLFAEYKK